MDKDTLFALACKPLEIEVPELGLCYLRIWSLKEREEFSQWFDRNKTKTAECNARVLILTLADSTGKALLTLDDLPKILALPGKVVDFIVAEAMKFNKLTEDANDEAKKNSLVN